jgi:antitoxin component YwqK of YwqJK toxin-antitoxin module
MQCKAITKSTGLQCSRQAQKGSFYCWQHKYYEGPKAKKSKTEKGYILIDQTFHENGKIKDKITFKDDIIYKEESWYANGRKELEHNYDEKSEGELDGPQYEWYENGNKKLVENYKLGKLDGERKEYDKNGKIIVDEIYKNGKLVK